jgi:carboxymethylenebutenolidase
MTVSKQTCDLGALFDEHVAEEFVAKDVAATMATMTAEPFVNHVPTMIGGKAVAEFYANYFIGHWPQDTTITPVSRTVGTDRVVDEMIMSFTHDIPMNTFLPGVAPTGRSVRLPVVVVMVFDGDKVAYERIYWDQASLLTQVGLIDEALLPVTGAIQAEKVLDKDIPANRLLARLSDSPG